MEEEEEDEEKDEEDEEKMEKEMKKEKKAHEWRGAGFSAQTFGCTLHTT